ncbi:MAG: hypothetical protein KDN18_16335, partial [Verrucomicrobiae bacterium]|nr:hypothetical protein [Verrucomicrobiae bacterium]
DSVPDDDGMADSSGAAYVFTIPSSPPTLRVIGKKTIITSKGRYSLKGSAADADGDLLRVEARDTRPAGRTTYRSARGTTRWSYRAPLRSGRNVVKIRAVDATGKQSRITRVTIQKR